MQNPNPQRHCEDPITQAKHHILEGNATATNPAPTVPAASSSTSSSQTTRQPAASKPISFNVALQLSTNTLQALHQNKIYNHLTPIQIARILANYIDLPGVIRYIKVNRKTLVEQLSADFNATKMLLEKKEVVDKFNPNDIAQIIDITLERNDKDKKNILNFFTDGSAAPNASLNSIFSEDNRNKYPIINDIFTRNAAIAEHVQRQSSVTMPGPKY